MTGGESSHKDVDASIVGLILFEIGVDHFKGVLVGESDLPYVDEWVGDEDEELMKLAPEAVEHQFGSGFTSRVLDDETGIEVDAFFLFV